MSSGCIRLHCRNNNLCGNVCSEKRFRQEFTKCSSQSGCKISIWPFSIISLVPIVGVGYCINHTFTFVINLPIGSQRFNTSTCRWRPPASRVSRSCSLRVISCANSVLKTANSTQTSAGDCQPILICAYYARQTLFVGYA